MRRFKSAGQAQGFLSAFGAITSHFRPGRHLCTAGVYREMMTRRLLLGKRGLPLKTQLIGAIVNLRHN
ncbi:hypothetical protein BH20ACI3_BH20ACI3_00160 [soil metagenome]